VAKVSMRLAKKRAGQPQLPKGSEAVVAIHRKYVTDVGPRLAKVEQWRQKSRQAKWVASVR
jgi:hypothetical protein